MKLDIRAFALACGLLWGTGRFVVTWWIMFFDGSVTDPTFLGRIYRGYTITPLGSFVGLAWAWVDGVIGGAIFAWLYNRLLVKRPATIEL